MKIEKDQIFLSNIRQKFLFHKYRGEGHLCSYLKNRIQWYWYPPLGIVSRFPSHVDIEISTQCNMHCPMCYRRTEKFKSRIKSHFMEREVFERIIEECAKYKLFSIRLSLRGEPFMHPHIFDFVKLAKRAGIKEVSSLTNGLALTPEKFERLVQLKFDWLTISFDGLDSTYESIRRPAKFDEAFEKIKSYHQIKKNYNSSKPAIRIQTIWPAIKNDPEEFYRIFAPYVDSITSNPLIDFLQEDKDIKYDRSFICPQLYQRLVIGSDGKVLLCTCDDYEDHIVGNVKSDSVYKIWHGRKLNEARMWFRKQTKNWWEYVPCKYCFYPRKKEKAGDALINGHKVDIHKYVDRSDEIREVLNEG